MEAGCQRLAPVAAQRPRDGTVLREPADGAVASALAHVTGL